jgi:Putative  PD-(D/E)XK family member, (DUF4420)
MPDLETLFSTLAPPEANLGGPCRFTALTVPEYDRHRLGKDDRSRPLLLIALGQQSPLESHPPICLENIAIQHSVRCRLARPGGHVEEGVFSVVHCMSDDATIQSHFLHAAGSAILSLGSAPSGGDVSRSIMELVELFRAISAIPRRSVQSLWSELFVIANSTEPLRLLAAWHTIPEEHFDFSDGPDRIEVKSSASRLRQHHFSLAQLRPPQGITVAVASLFTDRSAGGVSLAALTERVREFAGQAPPLLLHLDQVLSIALGSTPQAARETSFDWELAKESLRFYDAQEVPSISPELPAGVTEVHFKADLSYVQSAERLLRESGPGILSAALPREDLR